MHFHDTKRLFSVEKRSYNMKPSNAKLIASTRKSYYFVILHSTILKKEKETKVLLYVHAIRQDLLVDFEY